MWGNVQQVSLLIQAPSLQYELLATTALPYYCLTSCFTTATALLAALPLLFSAGLARINAPFLQYLLRSTHTHTTHTPHTLRLLVAALLFVCCNTTVFAFSRNTCSFCVSSHALTRLRRRYCVLQSNTRGAPAISLYTRNLSVHPQSLCIPAISLYAAVSRKYTHKKKRTTT